MKISPAVRLAEAPANTHPRVADRFWLSTLGPIPRLWCLACDKSAHAAKSGADVAPDRLAELRETHRCGPRTSPWTSGE